MPHFFEDFSSVPRFFEDFSSVPRYFEDLSLCLVFLTRTSFSSLSFDQGSYLCLVI